MYLAAGGLLTINLAWSLYKLGQGFNGDTIVNLLMAIALVMLALTLRTQILTVQDRVIRNEMRFRLAQVLPADLAAQVQRLERKQLVALRFASDAELPALVKDVLAGSLTATKDIKMRVKDWQADTLRA